MRVRVRVKGMSLLVGSFVFKMLSEGERHVKTFHF